MDDLVFSGAGSGCNGDDEDECPPLPDPGSGSDDLITPVYIPPTRPPPTTKPPHRPPGQEDLKPCDDEDCLPGSGSGETTEETTTTSHGTGIMPLIYFFIHVVLCFIYTMIAELVPRVTSDTSNVSIFEDPTTDIGPSEGYTPDGSDGTTNQGPSEISSNAGTSEFESTNAGSPSSMATESSSSQDKLPEPTIKYQPPGPDYPHYTKPPRKRPERVNSETSEIVALIIGIIAGALIAVILIILVILKFKSRGDRSYKVDDGKGYQQGPNAALLGNAGSTNGQTPYTMNGALRNGDRGQVPKSKKRDSKDIKEWYV